MENLKSVTYKGFEIIPWSNGFEKYFSSKPGGGSMDKFEFGILAQFAVRKEDESMGFTFAVSGLDMFAEPNSNKFSNEKLIEKATEMIKENLDAVKFSNGTEFNYEFHSNAFFPVDHPVWKE